ncbi:MAG: MotA/TolQ/ExbB proton channel family protein [Candidatus Hydrogenedentota bacterium]
MILLELQCFSEEGSSMIDVMTKGGVLMWPILLEAIIGLGIIIERGVILYKSKIPTINFFNEIKENLRQGFIYKAIALCDSLQGPIPLLVKEIIKNFEENKNVIKRESVQQIIDTICVREIPKLERNMVILAIIGYTATLLGLLGTVQGMIMCFMKVQEMGGVVNPSDLAAGIWTALLTTFAGLSVAIPTVICYNYYAHYINRMTNEIEVAANELYNFINLQFSNVLKNEG